MQEKPRHPALGIRFIGALKLLCAALLLAAGFGIFHLLGNDLGQEVEHFVRRLHLDPENKHVTRFLTDVAGISTRQLAAIDIGTFLYALLYIVEGVGLLMARHWAEYLTVVATASLVPVELYEIAHHTTGLKCGVLAVNVAILIYLIRALRRNRGTPTR